MTDLRPARFKRRRTPANVTRLSVARPAFPELLTPDEVAERLRCTRQHVYALTNRGDLGSVKVGRKRLVLASELLAFIERNTEEAAS